MTDKELKEAARREQNWYMREWKKRNPEKTKRYREQYWERRALRSLGLTVGN